MKLEWLTYMEVISHSTSLSQAAEYLYISQPTLSTAISALEKELGVTLLHRSSIGVRLTAEGVEFLKSASYILKEVDRLKHSFSKNNHTKTIRLAADPALCNALLLDVVAVMKKKDAQLAIYIDECFPDKCIEKLISGAADFAVAGVFDNEISSLQQICTKHHLLLEALNKDYFCFHLNGNSPLLAQNDTLSIETLTQFPLFIFQNMLDENRSPQFTEVIHKFPKRHSFLDRESIKKAVITHNGLTYLPYLFTLHDYIYQNNLIFPYTIPQYAIPFTYYCIYFENKLLTSAQLDILHLIEERLIIMQETYELHQKNTL
ncbi:MAG: LysR family transcriptional regulator [Peptococcaceae bacterium]